MRHASSTAPLIATPHHTAEPRERSGKAMMAKIAATTCRRNESRDVGAGPWSGMPEHLGDGEGEAERVPRVEEAAASVQVHGVVAGARDAAVQP